MKEAQDVLRVVGIILLGLFVLVVGVPLVLTAAGITLGILGFSSGSRSGGYQTGGSSRDWISDSCWYSRSATLILFGKTFRHTTSRAERLISTLDQFQKPGG